MEKVLNKNIRILIGHELGQTYFIIQEYINNKWQHHPKYKYFDNYSVNKKINELLKCDIHDVRKGNKIDIVKFKINHNVSVCINDYSYIKDYPEIKNLKRTLRQKVLYQKLTNNLTLVKTNHKPISSKDVLKIVTATTLSLGILGTASYIKMQSKENEYGLELIEELPVSINQINLVEPIDRKVDINSELANIAISNHKINIMSGNNNISKYEHDLIQEYADMYFMDYDKVYSIYYENYNEIMASDNIEKTFLLKVKDAFYLDDSIDKTSIITNLSSEEKEKYIIKIAKEVYKVEDEDTYALLLAIYRLETGWGTSDRCVYDNNPGGIREGKDFLTFKTFEIGVESYVRNVLKVKDIAIEQNSENQDIIYSMQPIYCPGQIEWAIEVSGLKDSILNNNDLDNYLENNQEYVKVIK